MIPSQINLYKYGRVSHDQKQHARVFVRKNLFWKYVANLQENTHAEVWFQ